MFGEEATMRRTFGFSVLLALLAVLSVGLAQIPEPPTDGSLLYDGAGVLDQAHFDRIRQIQEELSELGIPMGVATVTRLSQQGIDREADQFTEEWVREWGLDSDGNGRWVLVVLSVGDRRARILLGPEWDRGFERISQRMVLKGMVPHFKYGRYQNGLLWGAEKIRVELSKGLLHGPPERHPGELVLEKFQILQPVSFFSPRNMAVLTGLGLLLLVLALFSSRKSAPLLVGAGLLTIGLACFGEIVGPAVAFLVIVAALGMGGGGPVAPRAVALDEAEAAREPQARASKGARTYGGGEVTGSW